MRIVVVPLLCVLLVASCSATMKRGPAVYRPTVHGAPDCTRSRARPHADVAGGVLGLGLGTGAIGWAVARDDVFGPARVGGVLGGVVLGVIGAGYTKSAIGGYRRANRCRDAHTEYDAWQRREPGH